MTWLSGRTVPACEWTSLLTPTMNGGSPIVGSAVVTVLEQFIGNSACDAGRLFFCGIARTQAEMLDPFEQVFQLEIDDGTAVVRLSGPARMTSPVRAEAIRQPTAAVLLMAGNDDGG